jgi:hypothetical protein
MGSTAHRCGNNIRKKENTLSVLALIPLYHEKTFDVRWNSNE